MVKLSRFFELVGIFVFLTSVILAFLFFPLISAYVKYSFARRDNVTVVKKGSFITGMRNIVVANDSNFGIVIPKIGVNSSIVANVDPFDRYGSHKALTLGVAHSWGSSYPGKGGNIILFSNTPGNIIDVQKYNLPFYLLNKLSIGDPIVVYFKDTQYKYTVTGKSVVDEGNLVFNDVVIKPNTEFLSIMTLWPPGTSLKRLVVEAKKV